MIPEGVQRLYRRGAANPVLDLPLRDWPLLDLARLLESDPDPSHAAEIGASVLREKPGTGWTENAQTDVCSPVYAVSYWVLLRRVRGRDLRNRSEGRP